MLTASQKYGMISQAEFVEREGRRVVEVIQGKDNLIQVEPDDFVISMRSFQGGLEWCRLSGSTSFHYVPVTPIKHVVPRFFAHLLKSDRYISALRATTNLIRDGQEIRYSNFVQAPLPVVPESEQNVIASFLDRETAKIDALIAEQQRLIQLLQEKRQAVISHAVTKGLNPNAPMKDSGVEWLGEVPEHWEVKSIRMATERITYGFTNPMPTEETGPYMLTANDIDNGRVRFESCRRTSSHAFSRELTDKSRPANGDILLTKDGTLGRVALYLEQDEPACINQSVALLRPDISLCSGSFLAAALMSSSYQEKMLFDAGGTTIKHIYISRLGKMAVALPPKSEQEEILVNLDNATRPCQVLISDSVALLTLLRERRSALISAAVTGQIDVRELVEPEGSEQ
jgi:type I restriction enzyme, S subunit